MHSFNISFLVSMSVIDLYSSYCSVPNNSNIPSNISQAVDNCFSLHSSIPLKFNTFLISYWVLRDIPLKYCSYILPGFILDVTAAGSITTSAYILPPLASIYGISWSGFTWTITPLLDNVQCSSLRYTRNLTCSSIFR